MASKKWRTVAADGTTKSHASQPATYDWVGHQPDTDKFRVEVDEGYGAGWEWFSTVQSTGYGYEEI